MNELYDYPIYYIKVNEAKALLSLLRMEFIPREPFERYERIMQLMNDLDKFIINNDEEK